jgi:exodeoxyribonuclease VII small subunit
MTEAEIQGRARRSGAGDAPAVETGGLPVDPSTGSPLPVDPSTRDDPRSFEQLVDELERITDQLAGGELGIEAATDLYEQAEHVHELAQARLAQVQQRIDRLRAGRDRPSGANG